MGFKSKNMNYIFNIEYFENIEIPRSEKEASEETIERIKRHNQEIEKFSFAGNEIPVAELQGLSYEKRFSYHCFQLYTKYPGLLTGIGYPHEIKVDGAVKCGFLFDYVSGLPYLSGSSLKGMLRSYFPNSGRPDEKSKEYDAYIRGLLNKEDDFDLRGLEDNIFEYNDVFLGAYPDVKGCDEGILKMEYITPHEKFKDPNPISILKVKPNVPFIFSFLLMDYFKDAKKIVGAEEKLDLFKKLILDMGIGAKTNVGFGRFSQMKVCENKKLQDVEEGGGKR